MALSIKSEETSLAVAKLSALTGLSMTEAIRQAVDEKLARMQTTDEQVEHILAIGRDCASRLPSSLLTQDHGELLYGADGLPE
jgi:antitoxin VapB